MIKKKDYILKKSETFKEPLTKEEARNHPRKNILMNALGINDPVEIDIFDCNMEIEGIVLSSDGLTTMLTEEQIEHVLLEDLSIEEKVIKLIKATLNKKVLIHFLLYIFCSYNIINTKRQKNQVVKCYFL